MKRTSTAEGWVYFLYYCAFLRAPDSVWSSDSSRVEDAIRFRVLAEKGAIEVAVLPTNEEPRLGVDLIRACALELGLRGAQIQAVEDAGRVPIYGDSGVTWASGADGSIALALEGFMEEAPDAEATLRVDISIVGASASSLVVLPEVGSDGSFEETLPALLRVGRKVQPIWLAACGPLLWSRYRSPSFAMERSCFSDVQAAWMSFEARRIGVRRDAGSALPRVASLLCPTKDVELRLGEDVISGRWVCNETRTGVAFRRP